MKKYLITYDLKNHASYSNYMELHSAIKKISGFWCHYLESTWMIKNTDSTAKEISTELLKYVDQNKDLILVVEVKPENKGGWLPKKAWEWLNS